MYKVGDLIEILYSNCWAEEGEKFEVVGVDSDGTQPVRVIGRNGRGFWPVNNRFRKVEDMTEQETRLKLQAELEQAQKDRAISIEASDKEIAAIEREIKDSEVTYAIGDRFMRHGEKYLLVCMSNGKAEIVELRGGYSYGTGAVEVSNPARVTKEEILSMGWGFGNMKRYYDSRNRRTV